MVRLTGNMATNFGVAIDGGTAIYFPTSVNATETTAAGCGTADTTNSSGVFQCLTLAANKYDIRVNCGSAFRWFRYADEIQHATYQTGDGCSSGVEGNYYLGLGNDAGMRWSTADASNHALVIGVGNTSQQVHITDEAAMNTDWARCAGTHPEVAIHSNTTPATDYLALGNHDGTTATIDVVGGTTLALNIAGNTELTVTASGLNVPANSDILFTGTTGTNDIVLTNGLADALSITDGAADVLVIDTSAAGNVWTLTANLRITGDLTLPTDNDFLALGTSDDLQLLWSTGDCSNHAAVLALGASQQLHITDVGAKATDWARCGGTHPEVAIHSNTTPATDYLLIGPHNGTSAEIDVVGGTILRFKISGNAEALIDACGVCVVTGNFYSINNASVLNATTLGSAVVASSLTSVGAMTGLTLTDGSDLALGTGSDILMRLSTANGHACACCEDFVIALSDLCQSLHITDAAAVGTDWNIPKTTHPTVYIHSNNTPATDYLRISHNGTSAELDVVGGSILRFSIAGTASLEVDAGGLNVLDDQNVTFGTGSDYDQKYVSASTFLALSTTDSDGCGTNADVWRICDGQLSIDANTTWLDNQFDDYDDALVLQRAFSAEDRCPTVVGRDLMRNQKSELIAMGVLKEYKRPCGETCPDFIGYNDQRMSALLAGGVYQNRAKIDGLEQENADLRERVEVLEGAING